MDKADKKADSTNRAGSADNPPKRRVRYRGTHPRHFNEKYKELNPGLYSDEIKKVISRGQTPAGTHIPICVKEILEILKPQPGQTGLDATLGYGGHAQELLKHIVPGGLLFAIDVDPVELPRTESRLRAMGYSNEVLIVKRMNFAGISQITSQSGKLFDFVLADLGVSSMQLDTPSRGFSYKSEGPLDLRLNPHRGKGASELLATLDEQTLASLLHDNSDEPFAKEIAFAICPVKGKIKTTRDLSDIIKKTLSSNRPALSQDDIKASIQRVFQALRIAVNDELGVLKQFLNLLPECMKPGGRIAILTFHSGEDRIVKKSFQTGLRNGIYSSIARVPVRPGAQERHSNPRSSCAKLRWAVRAG
jgi:16S rRNA (cytosine1402-N4)-methyltransferase